MNSKQIARMMLLLGMGFFLAIGLAEVDLISLQATPTTVSTSFETDEDFLVGIEHTSTWNALTKTRTEDQTWGIWQRGGYFQYLVPDAYSYTPTTEQAHSGMRSAKLEVINPYTDERSRLQLLHDIDPYVEDVWIEAWYYLPRDNFSVPSGGWVALGKGTSERCWISQSVTLPNGETHNAGAYYQFNGPGVGMCRDSRSGRPTYNQEIFILGRGATSRGDQPDHLTTGVYEDLVPSDAHQDGYPLEWIDGPKWMPVFDEWFMIRQHVTRNVGDFVNRDTTKYDDGTYELWMAFSPDYVAEKIYPEGQVGAPGQRQIIPDTLRTVGIYPDLLDEIGPSHTTKGMAYVSTGVALYSYEDTDKMIYIDDIVISTGGSYTPPTYPPGNGNDNGNGNQTPPPLPGTDNQTGGPLPGLDDLTDVISSVDAELIPIGVTGFIGCGIVYYVATRKKYI